MIPGEDDAPILHDLRHVRGIDCHLCACQLLSRRGALSHGQALAFYGVHLGHGLTIEYVDGTRSEHAQGATGAPGPLR
jgi:hypothetical protein